MTTQKKPKEDMKVRPCPVCPADVGEPCKRPNGKNGPFAGWAHKERVMFVRYGLTPEEVSKAAQESFNSEIASILGTPYSCCEIGFADMGAHDRHVSRGHLDPTALGLVWSKSGWSSR